MGFINNYFTGIGSTLKNSLGAYTDKDKKGKAGALMLASLVPGLNSAVGLISLFAGAKGLIEASSAKKAATTEEEKLEADKKAAQSIFSMVTAGCYSVNSGGVAILGIGNLVNTIDNLDKNNNKEILDSINNNKDINIDY